MLDNPRAVAGHNNPPPSPLEAAEARIKNLRDEITFWLDGDPIPNQEVADDITNRLDEVRKAVKQADAERKAEKKPHDDAAKAVDAAWNPIIAHGKRLAQCCQDALTVWLRKLEDERRGRDPRLQRQSHRPRGSRSPAQRSEAGRPRRPQGREGQALRRDRGDQPRRLAPHRPCGRADRRRGSTEPLPDSRAGRVRAASHHLGRARRPRWQTHYSGLQRS